MEKQLPRDQERKGLAKDPLCKDLDKQAGRVQVSMHELPVKYEALTIEGQPHPLN